MIHVSRLDGVSLVYFVRVITDGPIKLGVSGSFKKHLESLRRTNHEMLEPLGVIRHKDMYTARGHEAQLKQQLAPICVRHEWFRAEPSLLDYIMRTAETVSEADVTPEEVATTAELVEAPVTVEQLAAFLHVNATVVRRAALKRRIPHVRVGRQFRFTISQVEDWLTRAAVRGFSARTTTDAPFELPVIKDPETKRQRKLDVERLMNASAYGLLEGGDTPPPIAPRIK